MTEEEAKTKWCPFSRVMMWEPQEGQNPAVNRNLADVNCIASGCMAWRWRRHKPKGWSGTAPVPAEGGHCGLAGGE